jgi:hypothetical protein
MAGQKVLGASRIRAQAEVEKGAWPKSWTVASDRARADRLEEDAALVPIQTEAGAGGELVTVLAGEMSSHYRNTVNDPSYVTAGASHDRLELAHEANVLEMGLDVAETVQASNSLEMMLSHQLAAAHRSSMKLDAQLNHQIGRMNGVISDKDLALRNVEVARLANSTARMMGAFQQGLLTLQRLKSGGRQVVTVQHVTVADGGQAVVAGQVTRGPKRRRGKKRKGGGSEDEDE